ncbi:ATP-binding cassette domain-containing protein [Treponema sp. OttesenSCG-928-L16]|nr:ATP-binding cassette domain-containing protein [Treponema sp. OttesenSCG-928-L16]
MAHQFLSFDSVEFSYSSSVFPVLKDISFEARRGWTGISGENGCGKTTLLMLGSGLLRPSSGIINKPALTLYCPQRTDELPDNWEDLFFSAANDAGRLMDRLRIGYDWPYRWESLSHGERKRLQMAAALYQDPEMLAVDEPTNHLDREARKLVSEALAEYRGIGLLVSHDRTLLDSLCGSCLFLRSGGAVLRPGGISRGIIEEEREQKEAARTRQNLMSERKRLAAETDKRRRTAESSQNRLSKKHLDPKDKDAKGKINLAKLTGKDAAGTKLYKRMQNRLDRTDKELKDHSVDYQRPSGITIRGQSSRSDRLFMLDAGAIPMDDSRSLVIPQLMMSPSDRIALTGPNGSGKSTLVSHILRQLPDTLKLLYIPQELDMEASRDLLDSIFKESEKDRGEILSRFSRLGSKPENILQSELPSPGEIRKLMVARGIFLAPALIIMDEPTNHMDLPSVRLLEDALNECASALLLVSHDDAFLSRLTRKEWAIEWTEGDSLLREIIIED